MGGGRGREEKSVLGQTKGQCAYHTCVRERERERENMFECELYGRERGLSISILSGNAKNIPRIE